jgi:RHS repeat-associated protein
VDAGADADLDGSSDGGGPVGSESSCDDLEDDDGDGLVDCADQDCRFSVACQAVAEVDLGALGRVAPDGSFHVGDLLDVMTSGVEPPQRDVAPGALDPWTSGVVRGRVVDTRGRVLAGARVRAYGRPEFGWTTTQRDGVFDLFVTSTGRIQIEVSMPGHPTVYRHAAAEAGEAVWASGDIVLTRYAQAATAVALGTGGLVTGERVEDAHGARTTRVFVPSTVGASLELEDGTTEPVDTLTLRVTEYTVGERGQDAMPAPLPPRIGYTWAAEVSADEAVARGARHVRFDGDVSVYVDDFLGVPVGALIPFGAYAPELMQWEPDRQAAHVVGVLGVDAATGAARLDLDGDGEAETAEALDAFGFEDEELSAIGSAYAPGAVFWRARIDHFSPIDGNLFSQLPGSAPLPSRAGLKKPRRQRRKRYGAWGEECTATGSVIECQTRGLREGVEVTGTGHTLWVVSDAEDAGGVVEVDLLEGVEDPVNSLDPSDVLGAVVTVEVAGHRLEQRRTTERMLVEPIMRLALPTEDAWGRSLDGAYTSIKIDVTFEYTREYLALLEAEFVSGGGRTRDSARSSFASAGRISGQPVATITSDRDVFRLGYTRTLRTRLTRGAHTPRLSAIHTLDRGKQVNRGDGTTFEIAPRIVLKAAQPSDRCVGCFTPPLSSRPRAGALTGLRAVTPNGEVYGYGPNTLFTGGDGENTFTYASETRQVLYRIDADGIAEVVTSYDASSAFTRQVVASRDGAALYMLETGARFGDPLTVTRLELSTGVREVVYDTSMFNEDGAQTRDVLDIAAGPSGDLYLIESRNRPAESQATWLRRLSASGQLEVVLAPEAGERTITAGEREVVELFEVELDAQGRVYVLWRESGQSRYVVELGAGGQVVRDLTALQRDGDRLTGLAEMFIDRRGGVYAYAPSLGGTLDLTRDDTFVVGGDRRAPPCVSVDRGDATRCRQSAQPLGIDLSGTIYLDTPGVARVVGRHRPGADDEFLVRDPRDPYVYAFDWAGRHLRTLDAYTGAAIEEISYEDGLPTRVADVRSGEVTTLTWSGGLLTAVVAPSGAPTNVGYDAQGRVDAIGRPDGAEDLFALADGLLLSHTDPAGNESTYAWTQERELERAVHPTGMGETTLSGQTVDGAYEVTLTDPLGLETIYSKALDGARYIERTTRPTGASSVLERGDELQSGGARMTLRDFDGVLHQWDGQSGLTTSKTNDSGLSYSMSTTYPSGAVVYTDSTEEVEDGVDGWERREVVVRRRGATGGSRTWRREWNGTTRVQTLTPPAGGAATVTQVVDAQGRVTSQVVGALAPRAFTYADAVEPSRIEHGVMSYDFTYDATGIATQTNALGETHRFGRDELGRLVSVTDPEGHAWTYGYDVVGELTRLTTPRGGEYTLERDALGNMTSFTAPGSGALQRDYTVGRRLERVTAPSGDTTQWTYDAAGRVESRTGPDDQTVYTYAPAREVLDSATRSPSAPGVPEHTLALTYDGGEIVGWTDTLGGQARAVTLERNGLRDVVAIVDDGERITLDRDAAGMIRALYGWSVERNGPVAMSSAYTRAGARIDVRYDTLGRTTGRTLRVGGAIVDGWDVSHDAAGRVLEQTTFDATTTRTKTFSYSASGRLETVADGAGATESYAYDANGNRTEDGAGQMTYDLADRRTSPETRYDANGRLSADGVWDYVYGARGELLSATRQADGYTLTYGWDVMGRLAWRSDGASWVRFRYLNLTQPFELSAAEGSDGTRTRYVYTLGGALMSVERGGQSFVVSSDQVGTPRVFADATGAVTRRVERDAFGQIVSDTDPSWVSWVGFAGGIEDPDTGLVRFGLRDYHPRHGRWTAPDPALFEGSPDNLYAYVHSNPVTFRDPTGLWCLGGSAFAGIGGGIQGCLTDEGFSWCGEIGVGAGGGLDLQPLAGLAKEGGEVEFALKASLGIFGVESGFKVNTCAEFTPTASIGAGPFTRSVNNDDSKFSEGPAEGPRNKARLKSGVEGKLSYKQCAQVKF